MKYLSLFFLAFFFTSISNSQEEYEFVGAIKLNDTSFITYQVKFLENNGDIKGYSITDLGGLHETKSNLVGNYSRENKVLSFKEYDIVYTKSEVIQDDFCFVNFKSNSFNLEKSFKFSGNFKGLFPDNTECINGEIILNSKEKMEKRIKKVERFVKKTKKIPDSLKSNYQVGKLMDSVKMNMLRNSQTLSVFSKSKTIDLVVFDGGKADGDNINVSINNKTILNNYEIQKEQKRIPITLSSKKTSIVLKANNVGSISTNTAVIEIYVDGNKIRALTNLKKDETTQIDIFLK